jgi:hypothetical protein
MTREQAIKILIESECSRWGEAERDAAMRMHSKRSVALAINEVANRIELEAWEKHMPSGLDSNALRAEAKKLMTSDDRRVLRRGG